MQAATLLLLIGLFPTLSIAQVQQASIITRPGVVTPPLRYHFDLSSALSEGVNQGVKAIISASNAEKTAVRFDSVRLFGKDGAVMGNNVASKTDALTANPYGFSFQNFGIAPADLANVDGIEIRFMDLGGENSTGKVTVQSVAISVTRDSGEACVIEDPIIIATPPLPPPTITQIQAARPLVRPGTLGSGSSEGTPTSVGPNYPSSATNTGAGAIFWSNPSNVYANDEASATATTGSSGQTQNLDATGFGFGSIPLSATINGIVVEVDRGVSPGAAANDVTVYLIQGASTISNNVATGTAWPASQAVATYGSSTNVSSFWGSITATQVAETTFGLRISAMITSPTQANIDYIRITVYYTPAGASVYDSLMDLIRTTKKTLLCRILPTPSCAK